MRGVAGAGLLLAASVLAACSQTAALAPVSGGRLAEVRFAVNDVLVARHVAILVAPVCTASGPGKVNIHCVGTTIDKRAIVADSRSTDQAVLTIVVGGTTIYRGRFLEVLDSAAAGSS